MAVGIALLGEVTAHVDGRVVDLGPARQRCVLAALAVDLGRVVPTDQLVSRVWGDDTPRRGARALHTYISRLRSVFAGALAIAHRSDGYTLVLDLADLPVDLFRFRALRDQARGLGDDTRKVSLLSEALALWRGEPLTGLSGQWAEGERDRWQHERWTAEHELIDARLRIGQGEELVAQLSARTVRHPLDERVAGQYMLALYRAGRPADAMAHYRHLRARLVEELGTDPSSAIQDLHRQILAADRGLTPAPGSGTEAVVIPRQLPAAPAPFVGRRSELDRLDAVKLGNGGTMLISAIGGTGGIGKTWLALHWAHHHLHRFPDGQLFVDLRGFGPDSTPLSPTVAVRGFLHALGVSPGNIPIDPQAQTGLLRSLVAHKRMLIVLDNAADTEQVAPLLPGGDSCMVVITSRRTLTGLITRHGAHHLTLNTLPTDEARALLVRRLGADRVASEPSAVAVLIRLCAGLPLALGIIAARAYADPDVPLAAFAADLRALGLDAFADEDPTTSLPAVLSWSYRALTDQQQRVFGLVGIAPGPDIDLSAAVSLTGLPSAQVGRALRDLQEASLLSRDAHGRYSMHDLVRRYAADLDIPHEVRTTALRRVVDFYLHTAYAADRLLEPNRPTQRFTAPVPGCEPFLAPDAPAALAWLDIEHPNLLAAQHTAADNQWHEAVWQLAWSLTTFHARQGHRREQLAVWQAALAAAEHLHESTIQVLAHRQLGYATAFLGQHDKAIEHLHQSLTLAENPDDQAYAHRALARAWGQQGDDRRALEHAGHALAIFRTLGDPAPEAWALNTMGWCAARLGDYDQARAHCEAALDLYRRHPDADGEAASWDSLGFIEHHAGNHEQAIHHYQQAVARYRDRGNPYEVANSLDGLGHPHAALRQHDQARAVWTEALELYRDQGRDEDAARIQRQLDSLT